MSLEGQQGLIHGIVRRQLYSFLLINFWLADFKGKSVLGRMSFF
jgi:hypothetical protein